MESQVFKDRLSYLLYKYSVNKSELARKLGLAVSTVHRWFNEGRTPTYDTIQKLADMFDVPVEWLAGKTDEIDQGEAFDPTTLFDDSDTIKEDELDEELVRLIRGLNPQQLQRVRDFLAGLRG
jgi:transcriptional regulator with XRE-family HTH domain